MALVVVPSPFFPPPPIWSHCFPPVVSAREQGWSFVAWEEKGLARHPPLPRAKPPAGLPARRRPPPAAVARLFVHVQILDVLPAEEEVGVDDVTGRDERRRTRRVEELATLDGGGVADLMVN